MHHTTVETNLSFFTAAARHIYVVPKQVLLVTLNLSLSSGRTNRKTHRQFGILRIPKKKSASFVLKKMHPSYSKKKSAPFVFPRGSARIFQTSQCELKRRAVSHVPTRVESFSFPPIRPSSPGLVHHTASVRISG
jgi:hypothetical protein